MTDRPPYGWNDAMDVSLLSKVKADLKTALLKKDDAVKSALAHDHGASFPG
jgi:hypothetical protein